MAAEGTQQQSVLPTQRMSLPVLTWEQISEPGAYVEIGSGDLFRIPQEALGPSSPLITKQSLGASRLVKVSENPFVNGSEFLAPNK